MRADFLDPLFEILGWDIQNKEGMSTNERAVLLEEALRGDANSNTKKPDYTFRLFSERKFFMEAKKPSIKIDIDAEPASQVRRYGFTARLKVSVLSNFEYLAIYDCSQKVEPTDSNTKGRIALYHYTEYEKNIEKIKSQLGYTSVYNGEFDEVWQDIEEQLKLSSVDHLFLNQINEWRILLGQEIYNFNNSISEIELNDVVQSYLNSLIFLRVCEDRQIETYKTLLTHRKTSNYSALIKQFSIADKKYNAGLFNQSHSKEIITNTHSAFWHIIAQLYYPESPYSFSVFASDILGSIYEMFLGEQLVIESKKISLKPKPEHINRDIVTTPTNIIKDILRETVVKHCEGKTDKLILQSTFADIACGSSAFLLETYQLIHDILVDYYLKHEPNVLIQLGLNSYKLPFSIKMQIITNCIFGVDRDFSAVQACKFGLLLKLLEGENEKSIPKPALPALEQNIFFGNSLLDPKNTPTSSLGTINPFDFTKYKFDVVIGNPPYMATEHMKQLTPLELPIYKTIYDTAYKQFDKYFLFIERAYNLLKPNGKIGYIVPIKFTKVGAGKNLRKFLKENKSVAKIVSFGANQLFQDKTTYTCLLILQKSPIQNIKFYEANSLKSWETRTINEKHFDSIDIDSLENDGWVLVSKDLKPVYNSILKNTATLETVLGVDAIYNGIQTSANSTYVHKPTKKDDDYFYFNKDGKEWKIEKDITRPYFKTSAGTDNLNTYRPFEPNSIVIYPYRDNTGRIEFITINELETNYPFAFKYFQFYKKVLANPKRDIKPVPETKNEWYRFGRHQSLEACNVKAKIIVGVLSKGDKYAIDYNGTLISSGGTAGYCMITPPESSPYSIFYIQALLNSKYLEWISALYGEVFRGGFIARGTKILKRLPLKLIDFGNPNEKSLHDEIAKTKADYAFITHMIYQLADNGIMATVVPHGVLFRGAAEGVIREYLIKELNYLDAVIGLPSNIFYGTSIPTCILVFKKCRKEDKNVVFIDASGDDHYMKVGNQNELRNEDVEQIINTYRERESKEKYSYVATLDEIADNDYNLNIPRYVDTFEEEEPIDLEEVSQRLISIDNDLEAVNNELVGFCNELGVQPPFKVLEDGE